MYTTNEIQRMAHTAPGGQFVYVRVGPHLDAADPDRPHNREGLVQVPGATVARFELAASGDWMPDRTYRNTSAFCEALIMARLDFGETP